MRELVMNGAAIPKATQRSSAGKPSQGDSPSPLFGDESRAVKSATEVPQSGPPQTGPRRVLRTPAAAEYIGLTASTLEKMRLFGTGPPFVRIGSRAVGYCIDDLDRFIEAGRRTSTSDTGSHPAHPNRSRHEAAPT
jgi:predicted DNA-binding transcriptional regulator AlpA